jgi:prevent-host-death family protein
MKHAARKRSTPTARALNAAAFKAEALAVMRRVHDTGQAVMITSRGKPLVRIEPIRDEARPRRGYGCMKGTVEILISDEDLVSASSGNWATLEEWDEAQKE